MEDRSTAQGRYVLVDANVIQATTSKPATKSTEVLACLKDLEAKDGCRLAISEFTVFENLRNLSGEKLQKAANILRGYEQKVVSLEVLGLAAVFSNLYNDEGYKDVTPGDFILAATAFILGGYVLTNNHKDFPPPFFHAEREFPLAYTKGYYTQHLDLVFLLLMRATPGPLW